MKTEKKGNWDRGGGGAHRYVLGSQTSHCAQVSGIKDMENGIKKYSWRWHFRGFRQVLLTQGHTKTCMHTHTYQHVQHQFVGLLHYYDE